jgi:Kef-type K+ transport system membrane component KefB
VHGGVTVFRDLFIVFLLARAAGELFARLRQPAILGEILVGVAVGANALGWVRSSDVLQAIAQIGIVFLLFQVGLENRLSDLRGVGGTAATVAVSGVVVPFALGFTLLSALGHSRAEALFAGAALVASSASVAARVIGELGLLRGSTTSSGFSCSRWSHPRRAGDCRRAASSCSWSRSSSSSS